MVIAMLVVVLVTGLAGAVVLLDRAVTSRDNPRVVGPAGAVGQVGEPTTDPSADDGEPQLTEEQVAAVNVAVRDVRDHPKDVDAHLRLARAYAAAGQNQLSTVEYLAAIRLDKANPEANTALALLAFVARQHEEAKTLVDTALRERPKYPEALYIRGLIQMMGLKDREAATRDLQAYLAVAPFGSHRADVELLLAIAKSEEGS